MNLGRQDINTVFNIKRIFEDIAVRHYQINTFAWGKDSEIGTTQISYPILWVNPINANMIKSSFNDRYTSIELEFNVKVLDLVKKDETDKVDTISNSLQIIQDIINEFNDHPYYQYKNLELISDILIEELEQYSDDQTFGWECTITFRIPNKNTWCGLPVQDLELYKADLTCKGDVIQGDIAFSRIEPTGARISYRPNDDYWNFINNPYPLNDLNPIYVQTLDYNYVARDTLLYDNEFGNKNRFTDRNGGQDFQGDGVAIDHLTGLMYSTTPLSFSKWDIAIDYPATSNHAGYTDWRMPNIREANTLWSAMYRLNLYRFITGQNPSVNLGSSTTRYDNTAYFHYVNYGSGSANGSKANTGALKWIMVRNWK